MGKMIKASDCQCCKCQERAAAFWPAFDPDIQSSPYCRKHLDQAQNELLILMHNDGFFDKPTKKTGAK